MRTVTSAASVLAALATCHRQAGDFATSASLFESLYEINERQSEGGAANQSGVMLARTLAGALCAVICARRMCSAACLTPLFTPSTSHTLLLLLPGRRCPVGGRALV